MRWLNQLKVIWILLLATVRTSYCNGNRLMTIGAIAAGAPKVVETCFSKYDRNITLVWYYVDTEEVFQIFRAIQLLDERTDVDLILLFDYPVTVLSVPDALKTRDTPLIKWGQRAPNPTEEDGVDDITVTSSKILPEDLCGDEIVPELLFGDLYCKTDINITQPYGDVISFRESLTLTAPRAMTSLVQKLEWKSLMILHETATEHEATELVDHLSASGILFSVFNVDKLSDLHQLLYDSYFLSVPTKQQLNIVVLCRFHCTRNIFRTANQFDNRKNPRKTLLRKFSRWLVAVYGHSKGVSRALQHCANDLDNVAIIAIPEFNGTASQDLHTILDGIVGDLAWETCLDSTNTMRQCLIEKLEETAVSWNPVASCLGYNIDTLLWTDNGRLFSPIGYMDNYGDVTVRSDIFPNTKYGYNQRKFVISTKPYPPFIYKDMVNGTAVYTGFIMDVVDQLAHVLNFTYTMTEPPDGKYGSLINGSHTEFNGLVGQLQKEEVDMAAAALSTESNREQVMDFTYPFFYEYSAVLVKKPDPNATKWRTLLDPFKWQVLLAIVGALPVVTTLVFLFERYNPFYQVPSNAMVRENSGGLHTWGDAFWYMYGALLCQGGVHLPDSTTGRTLVSFWWLFCIIIVGTYSGNLIAFLTVTKDKAPFSTLDELVQLKDEYKYGTMGSSVWTMVFSKSKSGIFRKLGDGLVEFNASDPSVLDTDEAAHVEKVKRGGYAYIGEKTYMDITVSQHCDLMVMKELFMPLNNALGFPDKSPHTAIFSAQLMTFHESGLFQVLKRMWWPKTNFCAPRSNTEAKPIALIDVQSAFYVCVVGIFVGIVIFLVEICVNKYLTFAKRRRRNLYRKSMQEAVQPRRTSTVPSKFSGTIETADSKFDYII